jgi:hypothetical protein
MVEFFLKINSTSSPIACLFALFELDARKTRSREYKAIFASPRFILQKKKFGCALHSLLNFAIFTVVNAENSQQLYRHNILNILVGTEFFKGMAPISCHH